MKPAPLHLRTAGGTLVKAPKRNVLSEGKLMPKPVPLRPGSMDFLSLPSVSAGIRRWKER